MLLKIAKATCLSEFIFTWFSVENVPKYNG